MIRHVFQGLCAVVLSTFSAEFSSAGAEETPPPVRVLFLGDAGHHQPRARFEQAVEPMSRRTIRLDDTGKLTDMNAEKLGGSDVSAIFANHDAIGAEQDRAMLDFMASGKGPKPNQ